MDIQKHKLYLEKLKKINYAKQDHWDIFKELFFKKISNFSEFEKFRINGLSNMLETGLPSEDLEETLNFFLPSILYFQKLILSENKVPYKNKIFREYQLLTIFQNSLICQN